MKAANKLFFELLRRIFMRIDRFLTLYLFHPILRSARGKIAILMYHSISDGSENGHPYFRTLTSPSAFAEQMRFLHENGYNVIDLMALVDDMNAGRAPPPKSVVLTFDDGFHDFYTNAFPVLQQYRFPAAVFLATQFIDEGSPFKGLRYLTWTQVRELAGYGVSFGSHTVSHPDLSRLPRNELEFELFESKQRIESELGKKVEAFSYPFAFPEHGSFFVRQLKPTLDRAGYKCCLTTRIGTVSAGDDLSRLKRLPANSLDDNLLLKAKIDGAYNWLYTCQVLYKRLSH